MRPARRTPVYHLVRRRRSHRLPRRRQPSSPAPARATSLASRAAFGDLAADDMVRRPEKSPPSGGYELREAGGLLGSPAPATGALPGLAGGASLFTPRQLWVVGQALAGWGTGSFSERASQ